MKFPAILLFLCASAYGADLRLGIIGSDTSHAIAFTKSLNDPASKDHVAGAHVVAFFKSGSKDIPESWGRVDKYADQLVNELHIEQAPDIATLCSKVDGILLESNDGRTHLAQAKQVIAAGKPLFIDKPLASTLEDAREIARLAAAANVKWFSTSGLRFGTIAKAMKFPDATGAITWGPGPVEAHHQLELGWYAIHPIEMLFAILGPGCEEVTRVSGGDADEITCRWKDGKIGTARTLRPYGDYGAVVFRPKMVVEQTTPKTPFSYVPLLTAIVKFFETGVPPVSNAETLEIFAFLDAAQRSKEAGGKPMKLR